MVYSSLYSTSDSRVSRSDLVAHTLVPVDFVPLSGPTSFLIFQCYYAATDHTSRHSLFYFPCSGEWLKFLHRNAGGLYDMMHRPSIRPDMSLIKSIFRCVNFRATRQICIVHQYAVAHKNEEESLGYITQPPVFQYAISTKQMPSRFYC